MKVVQVFAQEARIDREFDAINLDYRQANARAITADASLYSIVEAVGSIAVAGLLWHGGNRIAGGTLTFGVLVAFVEYLGKFFAPIRDLSTKYTVMQQAMAAAERVFSLLDTQAPDAPVIPADGLPTASPLITLDHVTFGYRADRPVLHDVSLEIAARRDGRHRGRDRGRQVDDHQALAAPLRSAGGAIRDRGRRRADARPARAAAADRRRQPGRLHVLGDAAGQHRARRRAARRRQDPLGRRARRRHPRAGHSPRGARRQSRSSAAPTSRRASGSSSPSRGRWPATPRS